MSNLELSKFDQTRRSSIQKNLLKLKIKVPQLKVHKTTQSNQNKFVTDEI